MPQISGNVVGVDFDAVITPTNLNTPQRFELGTAVLGTDGGTYQYVQAGGAIAASQSDISVSSSFIATDGSGSATGPATAITTGQQFWVKL